MAAVRILRIHNHILGGRSQALASSCSGGASSSQSLLRAAREGNVRGCEDALESGADVNWKDEDFFNYTALHLAAGAGHVEVCRLLLKRGAEIDPRSTSGETPLIMAARAQKSLELCDFLVSEGADLEAKTNYKKNARSAKEYLDEYYKEMGAPINCGLGSS
mmetsp:Transcript_1566/g.3697  ORF Transcript_1566/g.3697 Transcript_1566/m.3697 type:complete len:162 (+) Transcript_1566:46-531(+)